MGIKTLSRYFLAVSLILLVVCICALPASNTALPWSTHQATKILIVCGFALLLLARLLTKDFPSRRELWVWALALVICGYGWMLAAFPSAFVERSSGAILPLDSDPWTAFGSIDAQASTQAMQTVSVMFMMFLLTIHFARHRGCRIFIAVGITLSGMIAASAGLWLQSTADRTQLWHVLQAPSSVFGFFWYHGNAGAFLNLSWPVGIWLFMTMIQRRQNNIWKQIALALLVVAVLTQIIAVLANVSKMGHVIFVLESILLVSAIARLHLHQHSSDESNMRRIAVYTALILVLIAAGAWFTGASESWSRWNVFSSRHFDDPARRHAAEMAIRIGTDAGWLGTGPGTFEWISPHYADQDPVIQMCRWRYAHNDYAQFFAEWGFLGCCLLGFTLLMPVTRLLIEIFHAWSDQHSFVSYRRRLGVLCFGTAILAVLIHAAIDFPLQIMAIQFQLAVLGGLAVAMSLPPATFLPLKNEDENRSKRASRQRVSTEPAYFLSDS